ncbi:MAG: DUF6338 family protein [bacterium]|nr:DUF6338 family protein [bacterium]
MNRPSWLIFFIHSEEFYATHRLWYFICLVIIMFAAPALWPFIFVKLLPIVKIFVHPIKKPWDYVFGKRESYWIIVHLKEGSKVGGRFDTNSFASSYPAEEQIYIEEVWNLDQNGTFLEPIERSKGIIVLSTEILTNDLHLT